MLTRLQIGIYVLYFLVTLLESAFRLAGILD